MSPTSATITPIQTLQIIARTIPMITRIPPIPIPALLPDLCADIFVSLGGGNATGVFPAGNRIETGLRA
jgi:hypothetical protein